MLDEYSIILQKFVPCWKVLHLHGKYKAFVRQFFAYNFCRQLQYLVYFALRYQYQPQFLVGYLGLISN